MLDPFTISTDLATKIFYTIILKTSYTSMKTTFKPLRSFSFEIEDMNRPVDFVTVYAYSEDVAKEKFIEIVEQEYNYNPLSYSIEDEGELGVLPIEAFDSKYECYNPFGDEGSFIDKWDYYTQVAEISNKTPLNVWSVFDDTSIVCGMYNIDVIGYHITTEPGTERETYSHYEGEAHF